MAQEGAKNRKKLAMPQETLTRQMKFVSRQIPFAYVTHRHWLRDALFRTFFFLKVINVANPAYGDLDPYDLRQNSSAPFPPKFYIDFLHRASIQNEIGAEVRYEECPKAPFDLFLETGDVRFCVLHL